MLRFRFRSSCLAMMLCAVTAVLFLSTSAFATYPGQNGRIAFVGNFTGIWQLYTINPDGSDLFQVTNLPATELFPAAWFPNYSPDGHRIAFSHDMTGAIELYVINVDGTGLTQITHDGTENLFPQWSPDGTRILFSAQYIGDPFDFHNLVTISSDGTDRQLITRSLFNDVFPEYTIDGKQIVFTSTRGNLISALWTMNSNGSHGKRITEPALEAGAVDVSPDGHHMVFVNQAGTQLPSNLVVSNLDGTHQKNVTERGQFIDPAYSPNGKKIIFSGAAMEGDPLNLFIINSDGSARTLLLDARIHAGFRVGARSHKVGGLGLRSCSLGRVHEDAIGHNLKHFWSMKPKDTELCAATDCGRLAKWVAESISRFWQIQCFIRQGWSGTTLQ